MLNIYCSLRELDSLNLSFPLLLISVLEVLLTLPAFCKMGIRLAVVLLWEWTLKLNIKMHSKALWKKCKASVDYLLIEESIDRELKLSA